MEAEGKEHVDIQILPKAGGKGVGFGARFREEWDNKLLFFKNDPEKFLKTQDLA